MANFTSVHTGATIDASVTIISGSGVTQSDLTKLNAVTSSAVELNILDGVTASTAEINILDGLTASTTELNYLDGADSSITTLSLPDNTTITTFGASLVDDADAATARTTLGVDVAGTDNSTDVTLVTTSHDYLSLSGQAITLGQIDISDDTNLVGGDGLALTGDTLSVNVDDSSIEINSDTLRVKASGVTNAMLANSSVSYGGVSVALGASDATPAFDLSDATSLPIVAGTTGTLSVARGGTGATTASGARTNLNVDVAGTDNSTDVTLVTTSHDYLSLSGQAVTLGQIDISDDTNLVGGTGITLTGDTLSTTDSEIVHDNLSGFVSNEHIDHSSVSITAGTGLSGGGDITTSRTLTTDDSAIVHDNLSGFVANEHIDHSGVSITAGAGLTGGGDITSTRDIAVGAGTGVTVNADDIAIGQDVATSADVEFNSVTADIIGDIRGATKFSAKADVALNKGDAVYISGVSGNTPTVDIADANDASKMPSFGLAGSSVSINGSVEIFTFGTLPGLNTSSFSVGDILYVSTNGTSGNTLTATKPTGESSLLQNIGTVQRSHASAGSIKVGGAGRTNATPNLDDGDIFIGNGSNQAVSASLNAKIESYLDGGTSTANFDTISVDGVEITATPAELNKMDGVTSTTAELNYTDGVTSNIQTQLDLKAPLASPAFTGTATGANLTLSGDLTVNGSTTTLDTTNLAVEDNLMELNAGVTSNANDSGFLIERGSTGDNAIFMWDESADKFTLGTTTATGTTTGDITLSSTGTLVANVEGDVTGAVTGNADTATTLATARNFSLTGDVTAGAVSFDGSGNVALATTIAANSVALGTDTTGNYMSDLTEGTGIDITHTPAEGSNATIALDLTEVGFGGGANRLITDDGDGTVSTEANLTYSSLTLQIPSADGKVSVDKIEGYSNNTNSLFLNDDQTAANNMVSLQSINHINIMTDGNNNGVGDFRVYNGSYDIDTADLVFKVDSSGVLTSTDSSESMEYTPSNNYLTIHETGATKGSHLRLATDNSDFILSAGGSANQLSLYDVNGTANRLVVNNSGLFQFLNGISVSGDATFDTDTLKVDSTNNRVGIGTNSPGELLDVGGRIKLTSSGVLQWGSSANYGNLTWDGDSAIVQGQSGKDLDLRSGSSRNILFKIGSSEKARIDSAGNVGIGTDSPSAKLDVAGNIEINNSSNPTLTFQEGSLTKAQIVADNEGTAGGSLEFFTRVDGGSSTEKMRISAAGNVGIGTAHPASPLEVNGNVAFGDTATGIKGRIHSTDEYRINAIDVDENGYNSLHLRADGTDGLFIQKDTNNVGIGTNSPTAKLDVRGNVSFFSSDASDYVSFTHSDNGIIINSAGSTSNKMTLNTGGTTALTIDASQIVEIHDDIWCKTNLGAIRFGANKQGNIYENNDDLVFSVQSAGQDMIFENLNSAGSAYEINLFIDGSEQRVGIGTTSPGRQLTLYGEAVIRLDGNSADPGLDFNTSGTSDMQIRYRGSSDKLQVYSYGTSTNVMTIQKSDGFVGIGTESPSFKLKVNVDNASHTDWETIAAFQTKRAADSETEAGIMINSLGDALGGQIGSNYYWSDNVAARGNTGRSGAIFGMANNAGTVGNHSSFYWQTSPNNSNTLTDRMELDKNGNLKLFDNTANPSASAENAFLFCDSGELKVLDDAGHTTTISPHNFDLIPGGASEERAWGYYSEKDIVDDEGNVTTTQKVNVDMMKLARLVEELTGEKLVYTEED